MNVIAAFRLNKNLESAIAELEHIGIERKKILALPLESMADHEVAIPNQKRLFETAPILGTIFMLLGIIYGFILQWGPIIWAIFGLVGGTLSGFLIDVFRIKRKKRKAQNEKDKDGRLPEVFLVVHCYDRDQVLYVKEKLWKHLPIGVTTFFTDSKGDGLR